MVAPWHVYRIASLHHDRIIASLHLATLLVQIWRCVVAKLEFLVRSLESSLATFLPPTSCCSPTSQTAWELFLRPVQSGRTRLYSQRVPMYRMQHVRRYQELRYMENGPRDLQVEDRIMGIFLPAWHVGRFLWRAGFRFWATAPTARLERAMMRTSTSAPLVIWDGTHPSFLETILRQRQGDWTQSSQMGAWQWWQSLVCSFRQGAFVNAYSIIYCDFNSTLTWNLIFCQLVLAWNGLFLDNVKQIKKWVSFLKYVNLKVMSIYIYIYAM